MEKSYSSFTYTTSTVPPRTYSPTVYNEYNPWHAKRALRIVEQRHPSIKLNRDSRVMKHAHVPPPKHNYPKSRKNMWDSDSSDGMDVHREEHEHTDDDIYGGFDEWYRPTVAPPVNHLLRILDALPSKKYDHRYLCANPNVKVYDLMTRPHITKHYDWLSANPTTTCKYINMNPQHQWDMSRVSANLSTTIEDIAQYSAWEWDWAALSSNCGIKVHDILNHTHLPWRIDRVSSNTTLAYETVTAYPHLPWDHTRLSANTALTADNILSMNTRRMNADVGCAMSGNRSFTLQHMLANPEVKWCMCCASKNSSITLDDMLATPTVRWSRPTSHPSPVCESNSRSRYGWCFSCASENPSITYSMMKASSHLNWKHSRISLNTSLVSDDVLENPDRAWCFSNISRNTFGGGASSQRTIRYEV